MWKSIATIACLSLLLIGCGTDETEKAAEPDERGDVYEPISYGNEGGIERRGQIPTGKDSYFKRTAEKEFRDAKYNATNRSHDNDFNNEDAMAVVEKVHELKEVTMAQAYSTDDYMYVAVMINPYDRRDQNIPKKIEDKVKEITDKKVTIYTNNNNWDHMKDMNARLKSSKAPDKVKERIRHFFNQE
ncbi:YhcN/YlaJ family sporulation lipoprotein [Halobacillus litoralis]|uniref:YhcN/YlaJ family sporulation lipoprotein n=1 Tax=Halobacillus litoralis TaxID=45668 RepID=UPI001CFECF29|nr:YhcN/YlaJ family sporulation lipoprotein [Halobacillus litoralis]